MQKPSFNRLFSPLKGILRGWSTHLWTIVALMIACLLASPLFSILTSIFINTGEVWQHLAATFLGTYIINSAGLMLGVGLGVTLVGTGTAWLVTRCEFLGSRWFEWGLLLPLAAPAYILAYSYTELLEFYGPVQTTLRGWFGWQRVQDYWFPPIRSLPGAILMLILVLYPYVYLLARTAFLNQSISTLEASYSLGCNPWSSFWRVSLPLARPAIMAGLALALMETLSDYGTVQFFAVDTFTTGIFRTWFGLGERIAASQLSVCLMLLMLVLVWLERRARGRARVEQTSSRQQVLPTYTLRGWRQAGGILACVTPIFLGLVVPAGVLIQLLLTTSSTASSGENEGDFPTETTQISFAQLASHSLLLAVLTAGLAVGLALILAYGLRLFPTRLMRLATQISALGYAVPGAVIAVGTLVPLGQLDQFLSNWTESTLGFKTGLLFSGTIFALIFAYLVRFMAVSFNSVEASLSQIKPSLDEAARSLGHGPTSTLLHIHAPLMSRGLLTAAVLVFVDVMKELPATLIVRPPNFETLAAYVYYRAADEQLAAAAGPALLIVGVGLLPVVILSWQIRASRRLVQTKT